MVKLKILVTGASGLVGHQLVKDLSSSSDVYSCYNKSKPEFGNPTKMDLLNHNMISDVLLETKPDVVIHLGAMTGVDLCEKELALQTNVLGMLLNKCRFQSDGYGYYSNYGAKY